MTLLFIFLKGMLGLCTYMPDVIFSLQNLKISGPEISGHFEFSVFFSRDKCSCSGFDGGYNSEVETEPA